MTDIQPCSPEPSKRQQPTLVVACDFCRASIAADGRYHRITIAMNEAGQGARADACTVEEETELAACDRCEPAVAQRVDALLTELWQLMEE